MMVFIPAVSALVFVSAYIAMSLLLDEHDRRLAATKLGQVEDTVPGDSPIVRFLRPAWKTFAPSFAGLKVPRARSAYRELALSAGLEGSLTFEEFLAFCSVFFCGCLAVFVLSRSVVLLLAGGIYPALWIYERVKVRKGAIARELPAVVDMLALSVEAGLSLFGAIERICAKKKGSFLIDEMRRMLKFIELGASRRDGLGLLADRCRSRDVSSLITLILQAELLGAGVGQVLKQQAGYLRGERFRRAERMGASAAQKLLFPLVFCTMPATFIVIFGPVLIRFMSGDLKWIG